MDFGKNKAFIRECKKPLTPARIKLKISIPLRGLGAI
jgi:hypothetical protein